MQSLANHFLIQHLKYYSPLTGQNNLPKGFELLHNAQSALINNEFDKEKDTIMFFAGGGGIECCEFSGLTDGLLEEYNFVLIDYPCLKDQKTSLDYIIQHSRDCCEKALKELKTKYNAKDTDAVKEKVILCGHSMGTMVATKIAAQMSRDNKDSKPFQLLLNLASPINVKVPSIGVMKHDLPKALCRH